eukprot:11203469-Lingulodinium_polyedra.AAC.1
MAPRAQMRTRTREYTHARAWTHACEYIWVLRAYTRKRALSRAGLSWHTNNMSANAYFQTPVPEVVLRSATY